MSLAARANLRVAAAARERRRDAAMKIAFRTGGVVGFLTVASACSVPRWWCSSTRATRRVLEGFGFGAALLAMFMRVGGGIFTKAADVGADLVGKVEQGIPKTTRATRRPSPTTWATTSATAPAWPPTSSSRTRSPWSPR